MSNRNPSWEATLFSLACAFQCKQGRANSLRALRLRLEEIVACHADTSSQIRDTTCHPDPVILRPSPELGSHRVRSTDSECGAPALSASWRRTTPVPVVLPQRRSASKPKKNGAAISSCLSASSERAEAYFSRLRAISPKLPMFPKWSAHGYRAARRPPGRAAPASLRL